MTMTPEQKALIALIQRSDDIGDGWRFVKMPQLFAAILRHEYTGLFEFDKEQSRVRLSADGRVVARYV